MRTPAIPVLALLVTFSASTAHADVRAVSRNTLVFVTSTAEGEEWQAYRIVRPQEPAVYTVYGPGRVLLDIRSILIGDADTESVAVVLDEERAVLTARVPPKLDESARLVDQPSGQRPSMLGVFLLQVDEGKHRVTVRHSEGGDLLVSARFAEPLEEVSGDGDVPLVAPRAPAPPVQNVGALEGEDGELSAAPKTEPESWGEPDAEPIEQPRVRPPEPALESKDDEPPVTAVQPAPRALTVEAPYFQFELRGGLLFSRLSLAPAPMFGVDAQVAVPGLDARRWSLGASLDLIHSTVDAVARDPATQSAVSVVEVTQTSMVAMLDLRAKIYAVPGRFAAYAGLGAGGLYGTLVTESGPQRQDATLGGVLAGARIGASLGDVGSVPFAELRMLAGSVASDLARSEGGVVGDQTGYFAVGLSLGYRVALMAEIEAE